MVYGANGYTAQLVIEAACKQGLQPILAGRNQQAVESVAAETGLESRIFSLDDALSVQQNLKDVAVVLHCAGPFSATSQAMIEGCLASGCHYLDITGEISVFENAQRQARQAQRADIVVLPGAGFDVVPTDCLAASLVKALPAATNLVLAFKPGGGLSPGTARTSVEGLAKGGCVRCSGKLKRVPLAWKTREIPFVSGPRTAVTIPWGDVYTAFVSTVIPIIEVYIATPPATIRRLRLLRLVQPLLGLGWVQNMLKRRIGKSIKGPGQAARQRAQMQLWGEVSSADGRCVTATMTTPDGYDVTVAASLGIVRHLLENEVEGGFYTPSLLMGPDYAQSLPGVEQTAARVCPQASPGNTGST